VDTSVILDDVKMKKKSLNLEGYLTSIIKPEKRIGSNS
jgi:hypothetical protein